MLYPFFIREVVYGLLIEEQPQELPVHVIVKHGLP
jgi:hypothetical protein